MGGVCLHELDQYHGLVTLILGVELVSLVVLIIGLAFCTVFIFNN